MGASKSSGFGEISVIIPLRSMNLNSLWREQTILTGNLATATCFQVTVYYCCWVFTNVICTCTPCVGVNNFWCIYFSELALSISLFSTLINIEITVKYWPSMSLHPKWKEKKSNDSNECWEKPQKCTCISNALAFLFPSLRGPPKVWHHSWIQLSFKYLQLKS